MWQRHWRWGRAVIPIFLAAGGLFALAASGSRRKATGASSPDSDAGKPLTRKRILALRLRPWNDLTEQERLALLTPDTRKVALELVSRLRARGFDARLGETYRDEGSQKKKFEEGKSALREPGWHTLGRAFHVIIVDPKTKKVFPAAYTEAGRIAQELGVIWKGDRPFKNRYGKDVLDLAHFEYHPSLTLAEARRAAGIYA